MSASAAPDNFPFLEFAAEEKILVITFMVGLNWDFLRHSVAFLYLAVYMCAWVWELSPYNGDASGVHNEKHSPLLPSACRLLPALLWWLGYEHSWYRKAPSADTAALFTCSIALLIQSIF